MVCMIFYRCDICGKEMQNKMVCNGSDPLDCNYGEFMIETNINMQGYYELNFGDVCHECAKKINNIDIDDFQKFFIEKFMRQ